MEIVYCSRCQTRLNGADFDRGTAARLSNYIYCFECLTPEEKLLVEKLSKPTEPAPVRRTSSLKAVGASSGNIPSATRPPTERKTALKNPAVLGGIAAGAVVLLLLVVLMFRGGSKKEIAEAPPSPTPVPPVVRPPDPPAVWPLAADLDALKAELKGALAKNDFKGAQEILNRGRNLHDEGRWTQALAGLDRDAAEQSKGRFKELMDAAAKAADRKAADEVRAARDELSRWGPNYGHFLREFEERFPAAPVVVPDPEPAKPDPPPAPAVKAPDPGPVLVPDPSRSDAGRKYLIPWQKAMGFASRRDYDGAAGELRSAGRDLKEDDVQKELAADLQDLARLPALRSEILKELSALPTWTSVTLDVVQEDGSRRTVKSQVLQAGPRRLELRGQPRFVEWDDLTPGSLAKTYLARNKEVSLDDARVLALLCALDGDEASMKAVATGRGDLLTPKVRNYCASLKGKGVEADPGTRASEWAAKKLFYQAETDFKALETRGAALEKFDTLLGAHSGTAFVKSSKADIAARKDECRDYTFTGLRLKGKSVFSLQKLLISAPKEKDKIELLGWKCQQEPAADDPNVYVEASYYALPDTDYKGWALIGGCCTATFTWFLQATDLTYVDKKTRKTLNCDPGSNLAAPWDLKLKNLSVLHGGKGHTKAEKEPLQWEWVEIPMPKVTAPGVKSIRFMAASKGMALAAVHVSSLRPQRPTFEDVKTLADLAKDEEVPTGSLKCGKGEPDLLPQIPEARNYVLVHDLDLNKLSKPVKYDVDQRAEIKGPFDRIAYLLELQKGTAPGQFVFVSMDAFTDDISKVGVPSAANGARFQQKVTSMNVHSNVEGLTTGMQLDGGNIEFWPNNYAPGNAANVPGASGSAFDFGDQMTDPPDGYGCMQVHNHKAAQVIFALNHWNAGANGADLGIGNGGGKNPDYTFDANGGQYSLKRLRILVRPKG